MTGRSDSKPVSRSASRKPNRLAGEVSPYLLQHAFNPVDWWPWGDAAFAEARRRDVPILLSVGYSTCYWCHVMERESFESEVVAREMNERFVCIKLDREERPDVDDIYMTGLVMMTGRGGWPMNVFLDPTTLKPFWCGTYFPPEPRMNMPAWTQILERLGGAWRDQRAEVVAQAERVAEAVREHLSPDVAGSERAVIGQAQVTEAVGQLLKSFDRAEGGFGSAPKFPQPALLELLLSVRSLAADDATKDGIDEAVTRTLNKMACGGMFDQVGGGFHRYSVDGRWLVPHFEKMLYDNAQLARVYARASAAYDDEFYAQIAARTLDYVIREMTGTHGGFFAAQDAEVDGREGLNYLWTAAQVRELMDVREASFTERVYGLDQGPNFQDPHHPNEPSGNVLRLSDRPERLARAMGVSGADFAESLREANAALYQARQTRRQPALDDKVLASWNGLMIGAMAAAGASLGQPRFIDAAESAARHLRASMWEDGSLFRSSRNDTRSSPGILEDYACVISGLIDLHEATVTLDRQRDAERGNLEWAEQLADAAHAQFADAYGRYFDTRELCTDLFVRTASTSDGAVPSGLSVMLHALLDLGRITGKQRYLDRAAGLLAGIGRAVVDSPVGTVNAVRAIARVLTEPCFASIARTLATEDAQPALPSATDSLLAMEVYSSVDRVAVGVDQPGLVRLVLRIADGYHVVASELCDEAPGNDSGGRPQLQPMRVGISGGRGIRVYADYPAGERLKDPVGAEDLRSFIYTGTVEFDVAVEREGEWTGRPMLVLTYQACSDAECLPVRTVELDVAIDRA